MSSTPFGEHLKREREMRGVSLEEIAAATRISTRFLEALESGNWEVLPGGAFNRGFIRSTAKYLGLNEDSMVAEYALEAKEQNDSRAAVAANAAMPRDLRPLGIAVVVLLILIAAIAYGFHRLRQMHLHKQAATVALQTQVNTALLANTPVPSEAPAAHSNADPAPPDASPAASPETPDAAPASGSGTSVLGGGAVATVSASAPLGAPEPAVLELKLKDRKSGHIEVSVDGKRVFEGRIKSKSVKTFHGHNEFQVTSSDAGDLSLELNGNSVPVPANSKGQPFTISRKDLAPPQTPSKD